MSGRVLNEEEIDDLEQMALTPSSFVVDYEKDVLNLIATIRDRDKTIEELQKEIECLQAWREAHDQIVRQMDHYREVLRRIIAAYRCGADEDEMFDIAKEALLWTSHGRLSR